MPEIIEIKEWREWQPKTYLSEGYSLSDKETVQDAIKKFEMKFGYEPDTVWVLGKQVRIERRK